MTLMRPVVAAIVCLCSAGTCAYPYESERVKSEASSARALLPNAVSALLPSDAERRVFDAPFEFKCKKQKFHAGKPVGRSLTRIGRLHPRKGIRSNSHGLYRSFGAPPCICYCTPKSEVSRLRLERGGGRAAAPAQASAPILRACVQ